MHDCLPRLKTVLNEALEQTSIEPTGLFNALMKSAKSDVIFMVEQNRERKGNTMECLHQHMSLLYRQLMDC